MQIPDYKIDVAMPFKNSLQGIQAGMSLSNAMDQANEQRLAQQQRQVAQARQLKMNESISAIAKNQNRGLNDYISLVTEYPELGSHYKDMFSQISEQDKQNRISQIVPLYQSMVTGNPDITDKLLDDSITAFSNSGKQREAQGLSAIKQSFQKNPQAALDGLGVMLASTLPPEQLNALTTLRKTPAELEKIKADIREKNALAGKTETETGNITEIQPYKVQEARLANEEKQANVNKIAADLGLNTEKIGAEVAEIKSRIANSGNPSPEATKLINDSALASVTHEQMNNKLNTLADELEKNAGSLNWGAPGKIKEWWKNQTGNQDYLSMLKTRASEITNRMILDAIPKGGAVSDKDVMFAKEGFIDAKASNPQYVADFLRYHAKVEMLNKLTEDAKRDWAQENRGLLGKAKNDIVVKGVKVPRGMDYGEFIGKYLPDAYKQYTIEQGIKQSQNAGYRKY